MMEVRHQSGLVTFAARSSNGVLSGGQASHAPSLVHGRVRREFGGKG